MVTLNSASTSSVSVNYATADGTAVAATDYVQTSGTLVFPAGATSETITVPIVSVGTGGPTKTFTINLSSPVNATIAHGQGTGSILNSMTKFFVVDSGTPQTYHYGSGGTSEEIAPQQSNDSEPRGAATTAAGTTVWVVDGSKNIYVYDNHGVLKGSWSAGGLSSSAQLTGITTNGTDIWLIDSSAGKVYKYAGAASRLSGSQSAASSFSLVNGKNGNSNPQDLVTDGTSFWVVDGSSHKVFKYSLSGSSLGNWSIDPANAHPTGITIDPTNVSDIWIVDNGTDKVYQYVGAASRTSGNQNAAATFALNASDTDAQGIADPPPADDLVPAFPGLPAITPSAIVTLDTGSPVQPLSAQSAGRDAVFALLMDRLSGQPGSGSTESAMSSTATAHAETTSSPELFPDANRPVAAAAFGEMDAIATLRAAQATIDAAMDTQIDQVFAADWDTPCA